MTMRNFDQPERRQDTVSEFLASLERVRDGGIAEQQRRREQQMRTQAAGGMPEDTAVLDALRAVLEAVTPTPQIGRDPQEVLAEIRATQNDEMDPHGEFARLIERGQLRQAIKDKWDAAMTPGINSGQALVLEQHKAAELAALERLFYERDQAAIHESGLVSQDGYEAMSDAERGQIDRMSRQAALSEFQRVIATEMARPEGPGLAALAAIPTSVVPAQEQQQIRQAWALMNGNERRAALKRAEQAMVENDRDRTYGAAARHLP